ncbi:hypothetical protein BASA62_007446 [Batrachochytrium salamandrivorans]|nr:hypothetical protein BASA62_007446 [Batrachochytrium salamandrivorans]
MVSALWMIVAGLAALVVLFSYAVASAVRRVSHRFGITIRQVGMRQLKGVRVTNELHTQQVSLISLLIGKIGICFGRRLESHALVALYIEDVTVILRINSSLDLKSATEPSTTTPPSTPMHTKPPTHSPSPLIAIDKQIYRIWSFLSNTMVHYILNAVALDISRVHVEIQGPTGASIYQTDIHMIEAASATEESKISCIPHLTEQGVVPASGKCGAEIVISVSPWQLKTLTAETVLECEQPTLVSIALMRSSWGSFLIAHLSIDHPTIRTSEFSILENILRNYLDKNANASGHRNAPSPWTDSSNTYIIPELSSTQSDSNSEFVLPSKSTINIIEALTCISPRISIEINQAAVVHVFENPVQPTTSDESIPLQTPIAIDRSPNAHTLLVAVKTIRFLAQVERDAGRNRIIPRIELWASINDIACDLMSFERNKKTLSQFFSLNSANVNATVGHGETSSTCVVKCGIRVMEPHFILDPHFLHFLDAQGLLHPIEKRPGVPSNKIHAKTVLPSAIDKILGLNSLELSCTISIADAMFGLQVPLPGTEFNRQADMVRISLRTELLTTEVNMHVVLLSSAIASSNTLFDRLNLSTSTLSVIFTKVVVQAQRITPGPRRSSKRTNRTSSSTFLPENFVVVPKVSAVLTLGYSDLCFTVQGSMDFGSIFIDLSWLAPGNSLDYFAVVLTLRFLIHSLQKEKRSTETPIRESISAALLEKVEVVSPFDSIEIDANVTLLLASFNVILVGQVNKSGIIGSIHSVSATVGMRRDSNSSLALNLAMGSISSIHLATFVRFQTLELLQSPTAETHSVISLYNLQLILHDCTSLVQSDDSVLLNSSNNAMGPWNLQAADCLIDVSFAHLFIMIHSCVDLYKILTLLTPPKAPLHASLAVDPAAKAKSLVQLSLGSITAKVELPERVKLLMKLNEIKGDLNPDGTIHATSKSFDIQVYLKETNSPRSLANIADVALDLTPSTPFSSLKVALNMQLADIVVPHGFEMADIVENAINLVRALKTLVITSFGRSPLNSSKSGQTCIAKDSVPEIICSISRCSIDIEDDPFVSKLSRNYRIGTPRERLSSSSSNHNEIDKAWTLLEEFNSKAYISAIQKANTESDGQVYLLSAVLERISICLSAPTLLTDTVEETLHLLDASTPPDLIYDDLIPRNVSIQLQSINIRLRDYPYSLIKIPESPRGITLKTTGLLIIAEPELPAESRRTVQLPLEGLGVDPVIVTRSVSPTKIYVQTETEIKCSSVIRACYGAPLEACLTDLVAVIDSFTKANVDPSPPVGWWDKMRLMMHGNNCIRISGGGEMRLRTLGSMSPYYDPLKHFGMDGLELSLASGVRFMLGAQQSEDSIVLESGEVRLSLPQNEAVGQTSSQTQDDLLAKFTGGVRIAFGVKFMTFCPTEDRSKPVAETIPWKTHADIVLRSPEFCYAPSPDQVWDSFYGFRSSSLHVRINITSPKPYFSGLAVPSNHLCMNSTSFNQIQILTMIYQSILTSVPVRTRSFIFHPVQSGIALGPKPKLGRMLGTVRFVTTLKPLVVSFIAENDDASGGVGLRGRTTHMKSDMLFRQHQLTHIDDDSISISRRPAYRWDLEESQMSFEDIEGCTLTYSTPNNSSTSADMLAPFHLDGDVDHLIDSEEWTFAEDTFYTSDPSSFCFTPFLWSPRLLYFRRNVNSGYHHLYEQDLFDTQLSLLNARKRVIESDIWVLKEEQREIESRMAVFFDESIKKESAALMERLTALYEKRALIQNSIKDLVESLGISDSDMYTEDPGIDEDMRVFKHHYIFHNICFLWKVPVRNAIIKLIDLQTKNFALKYCLSNAASKVVSALINMIGSQRASSKGFSATSLSSDTPGSENGDSTNNRQSSAFDTSSPLSSAQLLDQLLHDLALGIRINVPNETEAEFEPVFTPPSPKKTELNSKFRKISKYTPSSDVNSPDYLAPGQMVESDSIITLINPQVAFEVKSVLDPVLVQSVIVAATGMELFSVMILDQAAAAARQGYEDKDRNDAIVKNRMILNVHEAQFFVGQESDGAGSSYDVPLAREGHEETNLQFMSSMQCWVPLECFLDTSSIDPRFVRIVEHASANFHRDKLNPLYFTRTSVASIEQADTHFLSLPQFCIAVNSAQYLLVHQVITSLLAYKDPARGKLAEHLRKVMLALEQLPDLRQMQDMMISLQEKVRQTGSVLKSCTTLNPHRRKELRQSLIQGRDELHVLMEALKGTQQIEKHRKSEGVEYQQCLQIDKFVWLMLLDSGDPFLRWTFTNPAFMWVHREDQSTLNTLEIDSLHVENLSASTSSFRDAISPYTPDRQIVNFKRNKMLRLYLREMAPVAGIQVVDHFEVDVFPLSIQITYEMGKQLMRYIFPGKKGGVAAASTSAPAATTSTHTTHTTTTTTNNNNNSTAPAPVSTFLGEVHSHTTLMLSRVSTNVDERERAQPRFPIDAHDSLSASHRGHISEDNSVAHRASIQLTAGSTPSSITSPKGGRKITAHNHRGSNRRSSRGLTELRQMQARASENRSFIYIKLPGVLHCLSYRGLKEKNLEDLHMFEFYLPTLEYRNKTWTWYDFVNAVKRDTMRAALANTGALVREKLFVKRKATLISTTSASSSSTGGTIGRSAVETSIYSSTPSDDSASSTYSASLDHSLFLDRINTPRSSHSSDEVPSGSAQGYDHRRKKDLIGGKSILRSLMRRVDRRGSDDVDHTDSQSANQDHRMQPKDSSHDDLSHPSGSSRRQSLEDPDQNSHSQQQNSHLGGFGRLVQQPQQQQQQVEDEMLVKGRLIFGKIYPDP